MASFAKYVGGSPTNTAIGAARLGLKSALVTRVGADHFGRFIREQLEREGVDIRAVASDPERLTALAILGILFEHFDLPNIPAAAPITTRNRTLRCVSREALARPRWPSV